MKKRTTLFCMLIGIHLSAISAMAGITITPNGVISWGTTLSICVTDLEIGEAVELEIVRDANNNRKAGKSEPRLLKRTAVKDGGGDGALKDGDKAEGVVSIDIRIAFNTEEGHYIARFFPGGDKPPKGALFVIEKESPTFWSLFKETVMDLPGIIRDPGPSLEGVRLKSSLIEMGKTDLWLMDPRDGKLLGPLTDSGDCFTPSWSPDGEKIAYVRRPEGKGRLWMLNISKEGAASKPLLLAEEHGGDIRNPVWSRKGDAIAFLSLDEGGADLWTIDPKGCNLHPITTGRRIGRILAWSRDDSAIFISSKSGEDDLILTEGGELLPLKPGSVKPDDLAAPHIWKVDVQNGNAKRVVFDVTWQWLPYFSPDGARLVYPVPMSGRGHDLWLRSGKNFTTAEPLTRGAAADIDPAWSPNGARIVFISNRER